MVVEGQFEGKELGLLVDTGATANLLSIAWWRKEGQPGQQQPRTGRMLCADGRPLTTEARVRGLLEIGGRVQEESFIVADIEAAAILR